MVKMILGGVNDEQEYVGVDDEKIFHGDLVSDDDSNSEYNPDTDEDDHDDLAIDDNAECSVIVHTDTDKS